MKYGILSSVLVLLFSMALVSGCGDTRPGIEEVIDKSIESTNQPQSFRAEMLSSDMEENPGQTSTVMEFVAPDRLHTVTRLSGDISSSEEMVQIGTITYTRENSTDVWHIRDWGDERMAAGNLAGSAVQSLKVLVDISELQDEKIDSIDCYHYIGSLNMQQQREEQFTALDESDPLYEQLKQSYESIEYTRDDVEFWISKDDYLLRQYTVYMLTTTNKDESKDTEEVENYGSTTTLRFYDYNEPIDITAPSTEPVEGVHLSARLNDVSPGSNDPERQTMSYEIKVVNMGNETAYDLKLFLETELTDEGHQIFEAEPDTMPVDLEPVDEAIYHVGWEFNLVELTKEKFIELLHQNTLRATWQDDQGKEHEAVLIQGRE